MGTYIYKKTKHRNIRKFLRIFGLTMAIVGFTFGLYTLSPLLSWELYLKPAFANSNFASPIPHTTVLTQDTLKSLLNNSISGNTWLPPIYNDSKNKAEISSYSLSIPKLKINATVSTVDTDLSQHLVHFPGTAVPPNKGNAVIFGHSTLPQLYDPKNYKTIFANIHTLSVGDKILVTTNNTLYTYIISKLTIVDAEDTSYLTQQTSDSSLTIVTCTPPGTTWKRLIIKSDIEKI